MAACCVQTIFTGLFKRYFGVLEDDAGQRSVTASDLWAVAERQLREQRERLAAPPQAAGSLPDNQRLCNPFLWRVQWDRMLRTGHTYEDYVRFAALPQGDNEKDLDGLPQLALGYVRLVSDEIYKGDMLFRKKMLTLDK
jgi:hypothetical protein